jgi:predicted nucleotide-binding protein
MTQPVVDQELVVHLFAPLDGPRADRAYRHLRRVWADCRARLGMTEPVPGMAVPAVLPQAHSEVRADGVIAAQEMGPAGDRQSVLRCVHDVLNLSVAMAQPSPEGLSAPSDGRLTPVRPGRGAARRMGWADFAQLWSGAAGPRTGALLGETRLLLGRTRPGSSGAVEATPELGKSLEPLLSYRDDRLSDWWRRGSTTAAGCAVWDTNRAGSGYLREIIVIAPADRADELSAWAWSDGTSGLPPLARYLLHAAKLRYEARLLEDWHQRLPDGADDVLAEPGTILPPGPPGADLPQSRLGRLRREEARLIKLETDLACLQRTVSSTHENLTMAAGPDVRDPAGLFADDQSLARWLAAQITEDLGYAGIDLRQVSRLRSLAAEEPGQAQAPAPADPALRGLSRPEQARAPLDGTGLQRRVFVVHGRDTALAGAFRALLRAAGLEPLEWETLVQGTGTAAPYLGQVVAQAPHLAQATLVLLSPDDIVELHSDLFKDNDHPHERARSGQARPNVLFELGLALMAYPKSTVVVEVGQMRPIGDLAGLNVIRFDGSATAKRKVLSRLELAGCVIDWPRADWLDAGGFDDLDSYRRGPDSDRSPGPGCPPRTIPVT